MSNRFETLFSIAKINTYFRLTSGPSMTLDEEERSALLDNGKTLKTRDGQTIILQTSAEHSLQNLNDSLAETAGRLVGLTQALITRTANYVKK